MQCISLILITFSSYKNQNHKLSGKEAKWKIHPDLKSIFHVNTHLAKMKYDI